MSAQLKRVETIYSGVFWSKLWVFSMFWQFVMELADSERVLMAGIMVEGTGDSVCGCDSKMAGGSAHFSCFVGCGDSGVGDELAVGVRAGGCKMMTLGVSGFA